MADPPPRTPSPTGPAVFKAGESQTVSPYNRRNRGNFDPGKSGILLKPNATYDRLFQGDSSMGTTVLVELDDFVKDLLPPLPADALILPENTLEDAKRALNSLFYSAVDPKKKLEPLENPIAEAVVGIINTVVPSYQHKAHLSRYRKQQSDESGYKVDAGLYLEKEAPLTESPDWIRCRFFIEFKKDKSYDPWDDNSSLPESPSVNRARTRAQLISYAHKVFLYQHRTALYSLVIFGDHFRAARWDRSGVIVSKKVNYLEDTEALLKLVVRLVKLNKDDQGLDPTAKLILPRNAAFRIMDELALANTEDMDYMEPGTEDYVPPPAHPPKDEDPPPASSTAPGASTVGTPSHTEDGAPQTAKSEPKAPGPKKPRAKKASAKGRDATQDLADDSANDPAEDPDPDLASMETWKNSTKRIFRYVRDKFRESLVPGWPRYKLKIESEGDVRTFLVAKPVFQSSAMFGRATRGYIAVDTRTGSFVFLKDSWRPFYEGVEPEGIYLEKFAGHDDIIVPQVLCHGDVRDQRALTARHKERLKRREADRCRAASQNVTLSVSTVDQNVSKKRRLSVDEDDGRGPGKPSPTEGDSNAADFNKSLRQHMHYRIAVKDVCLPFEEFRTAWQLVRLMFDCIWTHHRVFEEFKLLHRDISSGNVLIIPRLQLNEDGVESVVWRGVLTDWELAKPFVKDVAQNKARQPERTGTWQFMSVAYVDSQWTQPVSVADELESFFHVMLFYAVRFLPHNLLNTTDFVTQYFDTFQTDDEKGRQCSVAKRAAMLDGSIKGKSGNMVLWKLDWTTENPINWLISAILPPFQARYAILEYDAFLKEQASKAHTVAAVGSSGLKAPTQFQLLPPRASGWPSWLIQDKPGPPPPVEDKDEKKAPTDDQRELADRLLDHKMVLSLFASMLSIPAKEWSDTGVVQDQLVDYEPRIVLMPREAKPRTTCGSSSRRTGEGGSASKRPRKAGSNAIASTGSGFNFASAGTGSSFTSTGTGPHFASTTGSGKLPATDSSSSGLPGADQYRT